jgi:hypothetical protein
LTPCLRGLVETIDEKEVSVRKEKERRNEVSSHEINPSKIDDPGKGLEEAAEEEFWVSDDDSDSDESKIIRSISAISCESSLCKKYTTRSKEL